MLPRLALLAAVLLGGALAWPRLPDAVPATAPPGRFSAERALVHVRAWSTAPRPTGSAAHAAVLDGAEAELRRVGLNVVRERFSLTTDSGPVDVVNLVAHAPGAPAPAPDAGGVWLTAHTDSVPESPGAADDGLGLGVVMEVARALAVDGVPPGLHVLLTDGEELGLYGAIGHARAAAGDAAPRLVLNVEARGTEGPAYMFQLAGPPALLDAWRSAGCGAQATSLARAVYDVMPNDTDFTVFRRAGWWGYDFALLGGAWRYHTADDTPANLSPRSVQQVGDCVLGLARSWLARPLDPAAAPLDRVYFQALGGTVVLPPWAVRALGAAALLAFPWRHVGTWRVLVGVFAWGAALVAAGLAGAGLLAVAERVRPDLWDRPAEMVGPESWYLAAAALGLAVGAALARLGRAGVGWSLAGVLLAGAASLAAPTAGYVLVPGAWAAVLLARGRVDRALLPAFVAGMLVTPVLYAIYPALTTRTLPVLSVVPLLLAGWALGPVAPAVTPSRPSAAP